ncbi:MAG: mechanosensitive ion channel family protein [Desulfomonile tiedjei]|uniref:Mechanosensitive ion channel family protein n=1 Tax=Desulfomonile tiedjei TaxID=2358 RepID=A0A9D6Z2I1_9BACT|nr:mechanosensitive ion channel family protein [Desulfomonile tiedjei]
MRVVIRYLVVLFLTFAISVNSDAGDQTAHPLAPPNTSSPRATLDTFLDSMNKAIDAYKGGDREAAKKLAQPAVQCLNLEAEPPALRHLVGLDAALYLKEILDRIEIPPTQEIPDAKTVQTEKISSWTIPYTEITLATAKEESSAKRFLFTSDTIRNSEEFYYKVKHLPYKPESGHGALYEQFASSAGAIIPQGLIDSLPNWAKETFFGQTAWQWIGLALYVFIGAGIVLLIHKYGGKALDLLDRILESNFKRWVFGLILPAAIIVFARAGLWVTVNGLHIIDADVYLPIAYVLTFLSYLGTVWLIGVLFNRIADVVIAIGGFVAGDMDVQLIRLGFEILTVIIIIAAVIQLGARLGLPTYSLVAGLGIGGIAVALAGREALSNLLGTIMIILDRPFKLGDYITLSDGERGAVAEVGFRSTRIRTRDDILISIPNSIVANTKMINESAPVSLSRIRIGIGVAYGSDLKGVEDILLKLAEQNELVVREPSPRIRFRRFGDSALELELLCWIDLPELKGPTIHQLNWAIYEEFQKKGVEIPFPQRDVHIRTDK